MILRLLVILLLSGASLLAQRAQPIERPPISDREKAVRKKLEDVDTTGLTLEQIKSARIAKWRLTQAREKQEHRAQLRDDLEEDKTRENRPNTQRRGGMRVRLVWADTAAFEAWQSEFEGLPRIKNRFAFLITNPAYEFPGDDVTPPSGRRYTVIPVTIAEQHWLEAQGVTITQAHNFEPVIYETTP